MNQSNREEPVIEGRNLILVSLLSGVIWLVLANLILYFIQERTLAELFFSGNTFLAQIGIGTLSGALFGLSGLGIVRLPQFRKILNEYTIIRQIKQMDLSVHEIIYVSLIAGISEEILFRGAIQPVIGIWWTSVLFIGIHGYIRIQSVTHILYSLFTFALSMMLGGLFIYVGLISAMTAHFVYDVIVLFGMKRLLNGKDE